MGNIRQHLRFCDVIQFERLTYANWCQKKGWFVELSDCSNYDLLKLFN